MTASGESSIHNYECGSPPLIDLYQTLVAARRRPRRPVQRGGLPGLLRALVRPGPGRSRRGASRRDLRPHHPDLAGRAMVVDCASPPTARDR